MTYVDGTANHGLRAHRLHHALEELFRHSRLVGDVNKF